jgi:hypothetical protein
MPLKDRRSEYSWPPTSIADIHLLTDRRRYSHSEKVVATLGFRIVGGLREAFHPDVWTVAWEDFDKTVRLTVSSSVSVKRSLRSVRIADVKKEVRKATFYWSRDPDLPYRIWAMVIPEDGGAPIIPASVEDAKSKMLDFVKVFEIDASSLGSGRHSLFGSAAARWGRRSFIEKGQVSAVSKPVVVEIE